MQNKFELAESLSYLAFNFHRKFFMHLSKSFHEKKIQMTFDQWSVLVIVWSEDGLSQTALAQKLFKDKARMARLINHIESLGLIYRASNVLDSRGKIVFLTDKGKELMQQTTVVVQEDLEEAYAGIGSEKLKICKEVLRHAYNNL